MKDEKKKAAKNGFIEVLSPYITGGKAIKQASHCLQTLIVANKEITNHFVAWTLLIVFYNFFTFFLFQDGNAVIIK